MNSEDDVERNPEPDPGFMTVFMPAPVLGWGFRRDPRSAPTDSGHYVRTRLRDSKEGPDIDCPKSLPRTAKFVASSCVWTSPCLEWPMKWLLSTNRPRSHWILWYSWEDEYCKWQTSPVAWHARKGLPAAQAAIILLEAYWRNVMRNQENRVPGDALEGGDLVSDEQLRALARRIWPDQYPCEQQR